MEKGLVQKTLEEALRDGKPRLVILSGGSLFRERIYTGIIKSVDNKNFMILDKYQENVLLLISDVKRIDGPKSPRDWIGRRERRWS